MRNIKFKQSTVEKVFNPSQCVKIVDPKMYRMSQLKGYKFVET